MICLHKLKCIQAMHEKYEDEISENGILKRSHI